MSLPILDTPFQRDPDSDSSWESSFGLSPSRQAGRQPIPSAFCILNSQSPLSPFQRNVKSSLGGLAWLGSRLDPLPPNCLAGGTGLPTLLSPARQRQSFPTARSQLPSAPAPAFLHIPALNLAESSGWRTFPGLLRFGEHAVGVHSRRRYRHGHGREAARLPDECAVRGRAGRGGRKPLRSEPPGAGGWLREGFSGESSAEVTNRIARGWAAGVRPRGAATGGGDRPGGAQCRKGALEWKMGCAGQT